MEIIQPDPPEHYAGEIWSIYEEPEAVSETCDTTAAVRYSPARSGGEEDEECNDA